MSEQKSKNPLQKLKEKFDDKEEQLEVLGTFIRLGVMVWAGFIISLNYISFPGMSKDNSPKDITFIASVFTGCLATFYLDVNGTVADSDNSFAQVSVNGNNYSRSGLTYSVANNRTTWAFTHYPGGGFGSKTPMIDGTNTLVFTK